jgi:hypothetical protein
MTALPDHVRYFRDSAGIAAVGQSRALETALSFTEKGKPRNGWNQSVVGAKYPDQE